MFVNVRLFARLREIAGTPDVRLELPDEATATDAWRVLSGRHRELAAYSAIVSCAVNEEYARMTARLQEGDEVAFLPPVSGG